MNTTLAFLIPFAWPLVILVTVTVIGAVAITAMNVRAKNQAARAERREIERLQREIEALQRDRDRDRERIKTLERVITDKRHDLDEQIRAL